MKTTSNLVPLLIVRNARHALDFYCRALGATVTACHEHGPQNLISHADLRLGKRSFAITEEARAWNSDAPTSLGGSPVVLQLQVTDAELAVGSMCAAGATVVFPLH